jgi:hypothetical protein
VARARNIKPGFFTNDILAELPALTRLLFIGLWTIADRAGRLEDRPKRIKAEVMPYDECDADNMLSDLQRLGFISRYDANGTPAIQILTWAKHQNPHMKEADSTIQAPCESGASTGKARKAEQPKPEQAGLIPDSGSLIPDSLYSIPNGMGAEAPDAIWDTGLQFLVAKGVKERGARGFLGKMRQAVGDLVAAELLAKAQTQDVSEPVPWLRAASQRRLNDGRTKSGVAL